MNPFGVQVSAILLASVFSVGLIGCSLDQDSLVEIQKTKDGNAKLAAILTSPKHPKEIQSHVTTLLFRKGALRELMAAVEKLKGDDRQYLVRLLASNVMAYIEKKKYEGEKMKAFELGYYLLEYGDLLDKGESASKAKVATLTHFASELVNESLRHLKEQPDNVVQKDVVKKLLIAAALRRPDITFKELSTFLSQTAPDLKSFLYVNHVLTALKDTKVKEAQARFLLIWAKKAYPMVDSELAEQLYKNGNETLLRFLLDTVRDPRVPAEVRGLGMQAAQKLKEKALDGLFLALVPDDPKNRNIVRSNALNLIWDYGGSKMLTRALQTLPERATWWPDGTEFRNRVTEFCEGSLKDDAEAVRPILENLLYDPNWVARVYAMECMILLYDDAVTTLEPLKTDDTLLKGWISGQETTIGAYVSSLEEQ